MRKSRERCMISLSSNSSAKPSKLKTSTIPTAVAPPLCSRKKTGSNRNPKRHDHSSFVVIPLMLYLYILHIIQKLHLKYRRSSTSRPIRMVTYPINTHVQFLWAAITLLVVSMFMQIYVKRPLKGGSTHCITTCSNLEMIPSASSSFVRIS